MKKTIAISFISLVLAVGLASCRSWPDPPDLSGIDTVCLNIEKSRSEMEEGWIYNDEDIERILARLDFELVTEGSACDATLTLDGKGTPKGSSYKSSGGSTKYCYTGGRVTGEVTLSIPGQDPVSLSISGNKSVEGTIRGCPTSPPYYEAVYISMLEAFNHLWGAQFAARNMMDEKSYIKDFAVAQVEKMGLEAAPALLDCLWHEDLLVAGGCARALGPIGEETGVIPGLIEKLESDDPQTLLMAAYALQNIGPAAKDAVPGLISLLDDAREIPYAKPVNENAAEALEAITGERLGIDREAWQDWFEKQGE